MKFDIEDDTDEERTRLLHARVVDSITGEEVPNVKGFDSEAGWRQQWVPDTEADDRISTVKDKPLNLGKPLKLIEVIGNPVRIEY